MSNILGIETSCDETAVSLVNGSSILAEKVASQIDLHARFGGVVPEIASREHLKKINLLIQECMDESGLDIKDIDGIAVTSHPGLEGSLLVGLTAARTLAYLLDIPLIEVDHLEAHLFASAFVEMEPPPGLGIVVSGGHTRLILIKEWGKYEILGETRDDAVGECFDKVASILGLTYPGGPAIERCANQGDPASFKFPVSDMGDSLDFSYSGIKTAVLYKVKYDLEGKIDDKLRAELAASFQDAAFEPLLRNAARAVEEHDINWVLVCGGVAANGRLRELFGKRLPEIDTVFPPVRLCTDNASMVAACGEFYFKREAAIG